MNKQVKWHNGVEPWGQSAGHLQQFKHLMGSCLVFSKMRKLELIAKFVFGSENLRFQLCVYVLFLCLSLFFRCTFQRSLYKIHLAIKAIT